MTQFDVLLRVNLLEQLLKANAISKFLKGFGNINISYSKCPDCKGTGLNDYDTDCPLCGGVGEANDEDICTCMRCPIHKKIGD